MSDDTGEVARASLMKGKPMNETKPISPRLRLDDQGRAIPFTPTERQARSEALRLVLEEMHADSPDDPSEVTDSEIFRAIDSHRPERPLFEEYY